MYSVCLPLEMCRILDETDVCIARDLEREILPMCRQFGMAIVPYDAVGGGKLRSKKQLESGDRQATGKEMSDIEIKMSETLETIAQAHGIESVAAVALAWYLHDQAHSKNQVSLI